MDNVCEICGAPRKWIVVRDWVPGGNGLNPLAAECDWDHNAPNDCLQTINNKLDLILEKST